MKFHLISDNIDTIVGMRLAGITGVLVHEDEEVKKALTDAMARVEIPDRHGNGRTKDSITKYVRDAIGVKI